MTDRESLNTLPEVGERLRVSRTTVFNEIASGRLHVVKIGRRSFVTEEELTRYIAGLGSTSTKGEVSA